MQFYFIFHQKYLAFDSVFRRCSVSKCIYALNCFWYIYIETRAIVRCRWCWIDVLLSFPCIFRWLCSFCVALSCSNSVQNLNLQIETYYNEYGSTLIPEYMDMLNNIALPTHSLIIQTVWGTSFNNSIGLTSLK